MKKIIAMLLIGMLVFSTLNAFAATYTDKDTVKKVQQALNNAGYNCGTPDGIAGKKTYAAIGSYQKAKGLAETQQIDDALLQALGLAEAEGTAPVPENTAPDDSGNTSAGDSDITDLQKQLQSPDFFISVLNQSMANDLERYANVFAAEGKDIQTVYNHFATKSKSGVIVGDMPALCYCSDDGMVNVYFMGMHSGDTMENCTSIQAWLCDEQTLDRSVYLFLVELLSVCSYYYGETDETYTNTMLVPFALDDNGHISDENWNLEAGEHELYSTEKHTMSVDGGDGMYIFTVKPR